MVRPTPAGESILSYQPTITIATSVPSLLIITTTSLASFPSIFYIRALEALAMPRTHIPTNQHANHHFHARYMSNIVVGPGGQASLVAQSESQPSLAITSSLSDTEPATQTQQAVFSPPSAPASTPVTSSSSAVSATAVVTSSSSIMSSMTGTSSILTSSVVSESVYPSSITGSSTSTLTTSTASGTTSTSISTSRSSLAASSTSTSSSTTTSVTQDTTLYIGISLATIVVIACIAALIAWWIRLRSHTRKRNKSVSVPWASLPDSSFTDSDSLEKGESLQVSNPHDDPLQRTWEPRGDRDAGEPKRTKSYMDSINPPPKKHSGSILGLLSPPPVVYPFHNHPDPHQPLPHPYPASFASISPSNVTPLQESVAYPLPGSSRPLPPPPYLQFNLNNNHGADLAPPSVHMQFLTDPEFGTPRMEMLKPRYLSLDEQGLEVPWKVESPAAASTTDSVRHVPASLSVPVAPEHIFGSPASLSMRTSDESTAPIIHPPVPSATATHNESWSSSIKANIAYALHAVAKAAGGSHAEESDKLTALPGRIRGSIRSRNLDRHGGSGKFKALAPLETETETEWVEYFGGELVGKAPSPAQAHSQGRAELEETGEGRGVVHICTSPMSLSESEQLPFPGTVGTSLGLENMKKGKDQEYALSPLSSVASSRKGSVGSVGSYASTAALLVKKKNLSVRSTGTTRSNLRPFGSQRRPRYVYGGDAPRLPALPPFSRSRSRSSSSALSLSLSRMSTIRSMKSVHSVMTVLTEREEFAKKALIERRKGTGGNAVV
ncbi:hypothetical protein D9757_006014 [Collybiopsis confluens]|uniref:Uncharacterized protein n=1 Tax=Collybiopsis confluens TaxID=2823264 RepID=A0A8H5MCW1_9AGAR|nr:hypothetical protein D9757_006014 [Collybiopsis confluens]